MARLVGLGVLCLAVSCQEYGIDRTDDYYADPLGVVLEFDPDEHLFTGVCLDADVDIALVNGGDDRVRIDRIRLDSDSQAMRMSHSNPVPGPFYIEVGESTSVTITHLPSRPVEVHGVLTVESNDPRGDRSVSISALASDISRTQTFDPHDPPVDVLIAIDTSASMSGLLTGGEVIEGLTGLIDALELTTDDWKVGLLWGNDTCITGVVQPAGRVDPVADIAAGFPTLKAPENDLMFYMVEEALARTGSGGCNSQFLRDNATLAVVLLGNSIPERRKWDDVAGTWATYREDCRALTVHAMVDADTWDGDVNPNPYIDAAEATGGTVVNTPSATPWEQKWAQVGDSVAERARLLPLDTVPKSSSVEVEVAGEVWSAGWSLDQDLDGVRLVRPVAEGEDVTITYDISECTPRACTP